MLSKALEEPDVNWGWGGENPCTFNSTSKIYFFQYKQKFILLSACLIPMQGKVWTVPRCGSSVVTESAPRAASPQLVTVVGVCAATSAFQAASKTHKLIYRNKTDPWQARKLAICQNDF